MPSPDALPPLTAEWLETDGLGGFASGTVGGFRTRRYHALLLAATTPPSGRMVLVNGLDATVQTSAGQHAISTQHYLPDIESPDGVQRLIGFTAEPWPRWVWRLSDDWHIAQELFVVHEKAAVAISWTLIKIGSGGASPTKDAAQLTVRPFFSGRDFHALHRENDAFAFAPCELAAAATTAALPACLTWRPYPDLPSVRLRSNATYTHEPHWYRNFFYPAEAERGLDAVEDLAAPGIFTWDLAAGPAVLLIAAETGDLEEGDPQELFARLRFREMARRQLFASPLQRAADAYLARRGTGRTIIAGFPWFGDWGRDTFIALRGLCLATGRLEEAREILIQWSDSVSRGMLPNRFPDRGETPEYNSVDAALWYVVAVDAFLSLAETRRLPDFLADNTALRLRVAVDTILAGYAAGSRHGIRADRDGLLACGEPGVQLTWMDAKIGDRVITPRCGKPVEIQALWINALRIGGRWSPRWRAIATRAQTSFSERFWDEESGTLYDVVDCDHYSGTKDPSFRPNQIFALGGLPFALLTGERALRILQNVEQRLLTPLGLRSLAPGEPGYVARYLGGPSERDAAYHQGTVWPWLLGPFVEAWLRIMGSGAEARREAERRFLQPLRAELSRGGLGHLPEIADAEAPFAERGCPFQAWSLAEYLRLEALLTD